MIECMISFPSRGPAPLRSASQPGRYEYHCTGHAGYSDNGNDIVCAAASMCTAMLAGHLQNMNDARVLKCVTESGEAHIIAAVDGLPGEEGCSTFRQLRCQRLAAPRGTGCASYALKDWLRVAGFASRHRSPRGDVSPPACHGVPAGRFTASPGSENGSCGAGVYYAFKMALIGMLQLQAQYPKCVHVAADDKWDGGVMDGKQNDRSDD